MKKQKIGILIVVTLIFLSRILYVYLYNNTDIFYSDKYLLDHEKFSYQEAQRIRNNIRDLYRIKTGIDIPITLNWQDINDDRDFLNAYAYVTSTNPIRGYIIVHKGVFQYSRLDTQGIYLIISHEIAHIVGCCNGTVLSYCDRCDEHYRYNEDIADYCSADIMRAFFNTKDYLNVMDSAKNQIKDWYLNKKVNKKFIYWPPPKKGCNGDHSTADCRIKIISNGIRNEQMNNCAKTLN